MLLGMVPAVLANDITDALGIDEADVSMYVSEDTVLTEDVEGLVLVTDPVTVTAEANAAGSQVVVAQTASVSNITDATGGLDITGDGAGNMPTPSAPATDDGDDDNNSTQGSQGGTTTTTPDSSKIPGFDLKAVSSAEDIPDPSMIIGKTSTDEKINKDGTNEYDVTIGNVEEHEFKNTSAVEGKEVEKSDHWFGLAVPVPANGEDRYVLFIITYDEKTGYSVEELTPAIEGDGYDTYYFDGEKVKADGGYTIGVIKESDLKGTKWDPDKAATAAAEGVDEGEDNDGNADANDPEEEKDEKWLVDHFDYILHLKYNADKAEEEETPEEPEAPATEDEAPATEDEAPEVEAEEET